MHKELNCRKTYHASRKYQTQHPSVLQFSLFLVKYGLDIMARYALTQLFIISKTGLQAVKAGDITQRVFCLLTRGALRVQKCAIWNKLARVKLPLKEDSKLNTSSTEASLTQRQKTIA